MNKFYEIAKMHEELYDSDLSNFLYYLEVMNNLGIEIEAAQLEEKGVRLMTSHSTKGLEYKTVIVTNFAQGRFPIERYSGNSLIPTELMPEVKEEIKKMNQEEKENYVVKYEKYHQLLEERRLAYVSFTRAKEKLVLTFADDYGGKKTFPSAFLLETKYDKNPDIIFCKDLEEKYKEKEEIKDALKFSTALDSQNFDSLLNEMVKSNEKNKEKENRKLSPSALLLFDKCQKEFEYKYVYNMPERKTFSWEAMRLGSFVHLALERGVSLSLKTTEDFIYLAKELALEEEWEGIEFRDAEVLIRVFFERNKGRYNDNSKTEQYLPLILAGISFMGFADRIDFNSEGFEIIDYKTGKTNIAPKDRNWQLGFYALAAQEKYRKFGRVRKVILDMLKQDKPLEFQIDEEGNAFCVSSKFIDGFNIYDVEKELIETAKNIQDAYKQGFKPCSIEKNCEFCNEYVYGF